MPQWLEKVAEIVNYRHTPQSRLFYNPAWAGVVELEEHRRGPHVLPHWPPPLLCEFHQGARESSSEGSEDRNFIDVIWEA